mmetsp:Transcript_39884/g.77542  ORF Transcript_39884/g.77542 Transcript_39884/m.77542 type:complete len:111 (+) Transcript_39884:2087-2419(+)
MISSQRTHTWTIRTPLGMAKFNKHQPSLTTINDNEEDTKKIPNEKKTTNIKQPSAPNPRAGVLRACSGSRKQTTTTKKKKKKKKEKRKKTRNEASSTNQGSYSCDICMDT